MQGNKGMLPAISAIALVPADEAGRGEMVSEKERDQQIRFIRHCIS